ncbi:hypothetical protein Tco_1255619 [Tanacetum coccineum]
MLVQKCSSQERSKIISRLKIKISSLKLKDIKSKIKIQDLKHAKGTSKEFPSTQCSKIQDTTRSEAKGTTIDPKFSRRNIQLTDIDHTSNLVTVLSGVSTKYQMDQTQSTRFEVSDPDQNKGNTSFEVEPDSEPLILTTFGDIQALLDSEDELKDESNEEMYEAKKEMDYEIQQPVDEETHPPHSTNPKPTEDEYSTE